jgi:hypothetical protein
MKILNLSNIDRYFYMAEFPYYKTLKFQGTLSRVHGIALNTITNESEKFGIKLNLDNTITIGVGSDILKTFQ